MSEFTNQERQTLRDHWPTTAPSEGFADKVLETLHADTDTQETEATSVSPRNTGRWLRWSAVCIAAVVAVSLFARRSPDTIHVNGELIAKSQTTQNIGKRAVMVAEPGAVLRWRGTLAGRVDVTQTNGRVFYRVDRAARMPFVVSTSHGDIEVAGTCFEIEVKEKEKDMNIKTLAAGAAIGAVLAVTVYEGRVIFRDKDGGTTEVSPGQVAQVAGKGGDVLLAARKPSSDETGDELRVPADIKSMPRAELEQSMSSLATRAAALKKQNEMMRAALDKKGDGGTNEDFFTDDPSTLMEWAKECKVKTDVPVFNGQIGPKKREELNVSPEEEKAVEEVLKNIGQAWSEKVRALYIEATGDVSRADNLSTMAMTMELRDKSAPGELAGVMRQLSRERAGLSQPPKDLSGLSAVERFVRGEAALGDQFEAELAARIGPSRAREFRRKSIAGSMHGVYAGCPGEPHEADEDR